jgi:gas vesicle protein
VRLVVSSVSLNLKAVFDEAAAIVRSVEGQTHTVADNAAPQQLIDKAEAARNLTSRIEAFVQAMPKTASGDVERLVRAFQQAGDVLSAQPDRQAASPAGIDAAEKGPAGTPEDLAAAAGRQIIAKVNEIAGRLQDLGRQLMQSEEKIPRDAASPANRQADLVQNSLKEALRQLDSLARAATDQTSSASREISRTLDDLASEVSKRLDNMASDQDRQQQRGPLDVLKQQVENALTRVESLQVLARQVSVTDGQQQVISLPMKIEGQWTDVVVKFLKKKDPGGNKDAPDKPVSVAIHVSPAMLGQIDVFMDYRGKKRFSMRMEFEKTATRSWFEKNKTDFSAALSQIGFTTFKIDMKEAVRNARRGIAAPAQNAVGVTSSYDDRGPGVIDITA